MFIDNISTNTLPRNTAAAAAGQASRAEQVAKDFEALFTSMMFKSMRGSVNENSLIPKSLGENIFTEMLDGEYAKMSAQKGTLGLAALIQKEIERSEGKNMPSTDADAPLWAMQRQRPASASSSRGGNSANNGNLIDRVRGRWQSLISEISARHGMDEHLVTAVIARESSGNPNAISPKGAKGLMQLMDGTARELGVKYSFAPAENIDGGVRYLKNMLRMFNGDERLALAAYNAGPGAVRRFGGIPPYRETQEYVTAVLALRERAAAPVAQKAEEAE
ncbi:MAG: transglycosylase SLT domain-containing protein [Chitinispirillales bacterium]|jgi:soluble lytic murein transglycosylase-like protein|nr:transglycosylase SLT domain-containing protein [Chitinispirillales bacterium]